jgi:tRNA pseudouridine55 synthase
MKWGFLNINKPLRATSRDIVNRVSRSAKSRKVGHTGTLDPLAQGVLVVGIGPATRLTEHVQSTRKGYLARFRLGQTSTTDDAEGELTPQIPTNHISDANIRAVLRNFLGTIQQIPPRFSAIHVSGRRAYDLARAGAEFELAARPVEIHAIELLSFRDSEIELRIECGSGTYVRSIGRDLGEMLGCGAYMTALTRTLVGPFRIEESLALDQFTGPPTFEELQPHLISPTVIFPLEQRVVVASATILRVRQGQTIGRSDLIEGSMWGQATEFSPALPYCIVDESGAMIALAEHRLETGRLHPKLVVPQELDATT